MSLTDAGQNDMRHEGLPEILAKLTAVIFTESTSRSAQLDAVNTTAEVLD